MFLVRLEYENGDVKTFQAGSNHAGAKAFVGGIIGQSQKLKEQLDPDGSLGIFAPVKRYALRKRGGTFTGISQILPEADKPSPNQEWRRKQREARERQSKQRSSQLEHWIRTGGNYPPQAEAV